MKMPYAVLTSQPLLLLHICTEPPHPLKEASVDTTLSNDTLLIGEPWQSKLGLLHGRGAIMQEEFIISLLWRLETGWSNLELW